MNIDQIIDGVLRRELPAETRPLPLPEAWTRTKAAAHAADRGGWTRGGITVRSWAEFKGLGSRHASRAELEAIAYEDARAYYRQQYVGPWESYPEPLRTLLVDFAVTSWHDDPARALQRALRDQGLYLGPIDGVAGQKTLAGLADASCDQRRLYLDVLVNRARHYVAVAFADRQVREFLRTHPTTQLHNLRGWLAGRILPFIH